jgi:hypothetical protein
MSNRQTRSSRFSQKGFPLGLQPALPWTAILGFCLMSAFLILVGGGKILNLVFPAGALAVGVLLYVRAPLLYVGFIWWMWFLTPLIRRLADWKTGFTDPSPILLAPYLVTLVTLVTLWKTLPKTFRQGGFPFVLSLVGVFYGFCVGLIYRSPIQVGIACLDWLTPILFGFHLFVNWQNYPQYRQNIQRVFFFGVLVMGVYGIFQFLVAPDWDRYWLIQSGFSSGGKPEPLKMNVWSTMASNRPFGTVMMAGLLSLLVYKQKGGLAIPATVAGYISFLLARKRTTWVSWFIGLFILLGTLKANIQMRILTALTGIFLCVLTLVNMEPFSTFIMDRFETFSDLENDPSAEARSQTFDQTINLAMNSYLGEGIGGGSLDNGILLTLLNLGWLGSLFYVSGIFLLLFTFFQGDASRLDSFLGASRAISIATLVQIPLGNSHLEVQGMILWGFLCLGIASKKYFLFQSNLLRNHHYG